MRRIDRLTKHTCPNLELDLDFARQQGLPERSCVNCGTEIPVHFAQFELICQACRNECLDDSDVAIQKCAWCGQPKEV